MQMKGENVITAERTIINVGFLSFCLPLCYYQPEKKVRSKMLCVCGCSNISTHKKCLGLFLFPVKVHQHHKKIIKQANKQNQCFFAFHSVISCFPFVVFARRIVTQPSQFVSQSVSQPASFILCLAVCLSLCVCVPKFIYSPKTLKTNVKTKTTQKLRAHLLLPA